MFKFQCLSCGSTELSYEKWVRCREKVLHRPDGHIEYNDQQINDNEVCRFGRGYTCTCCGKPLMLYRDVLATEDELEEYLGLTMEERVQMEDYKVPSDDDLDLPGYDKMLL
jgi:hypothetical protein